MNKEAELFDIHSHIQEVQYEDDRAAVLARMEEESVSTIAVGVDRASSARAVALGEAHPRVFACVGVHPNDNRSEVFDEHAFSALCESSRVVAIGECGLDYFRGGETAQERARQKNIFADQIVFAAKHNLPLMLHVRGTKDSPLDAHREVIDMIRAHQHRYGDRVRGNVHFFSGDAETARHYIECGFTISLSGVITFAHEYDEVVLRTPLEHMMAETDAPYATPVPFRGKRNEPVHVAQVISRMAEITGKDQHTIKTILRSNVQRVFGI